MRRFISWVGLFAALCGLAGENALAQFTNDIVTPWYGGTDHYYGSALIASAGTFNNSAALVYNTSILPGDTGPLYAWDLAPGVTIAGDYYDGVGVLSVNHGWTNVINNNSGGTIQGIVTGAGEAFAMGLFAYSDNVNTYLINNFGWMDGEVWNNDGTTAGVYAGGNVTITNYPGATLSATAPYYATGVYTSGGGAQYVVNDGTITATATGGTQGASASQAYCADINMFSYDPADMSPIYVVNNGSVTASCAGGATNIAHCGAIWNDQNNVTWINNGAMTATMTGSSGDASGIYFGANNADVTFINTGTVNNGGGTSNGGEGVWMENDSTNGNMYFYNSGTIASGEPFALAIADYDNESPYGNAYVTNTGTISGGWLGLAWPGDMIFYDSGNIYTALAWLGVGTNFTNFGNVTVYISGLPTIQPTLGAGAGSNTLVFNLTGTLQSVNGTPAGGSDLSVFNLGILGSGNIVVSGKTYSWANFTNVSGTITAPMPLNPGPTNLIASATSPNQASLVWQSVANATGYNVKRSTTSDGPYTTIASGITSTNDTDPAAFASLEYYYVVSAIVGGSETANSPEAALRHPRLAGTIIGTAGSFANSGNTITNVFDNNLDTYFDGPSANGCWVGLDFGAGMSNVITKINYCPRNGYESRMVGGVFQGANQPDFSAAVTLFSISNQPPAGFLSPVSITNAAAFRYVRYLSPNGSYGDIAGLQFYSYPTVSPPQAPAGLTAVLISSNQVNLTWNIVTNAPGFNVKRSTTDYGPYTVIAGGLMATNYSDTGLAGGAIYYYVVSAVNTNGESLNSTQASSTTPSPEYGTLIHRYSFSEANGATTFADSIGGPVWDGALPNDGTFSNGQIILSPTANQYGNLPYGVVSSLTNITVMAWINLNSTPTWSRVFDFGNNTTTYMFMTPAAGGTGALRFAMTTNGPGSEQQINCANTISINVSHQVAVSMNSGMGVLYLDGVAVGTNNSMTMNPSSLGVTTNNFLGKSQFSDPYLDGSFDEFRIYNVGLSAAQVAATFALGPNQQLNPGSPPLNLGMAGGNLALTWPLGWAGFTLQSCTNLMGGNWVNLTSPTPQIVGNQWQVTLPQAGVNNTTFYRLVNN